MALENFFDVLPDDWQYITLGEACKQGGGNIQTGPFGSQLHASDYVETGIPTIMPQNIGDNRVIENGISRITEQDAERLAKYRVRTGDIVYSRRGDVERRSLIRKHEDGWLCGTGSLRVRFGSGVVDPVYASFYLGHPSVREWIVRHAHGATMPNLNTSILSAMPFALPPLPEQRSIAAILGSLDDKIELNRQMNRSLEEMAQALFKSWFVDFDPVRAKAEGRETGLPDDVVALFPDRLVESELGEIPEGWQPKSLKEITSKIGSGATPRGGSAIYVEEGVNLIRSQNVYDSDFSWEGLAKITGDEARKLESVTVLRNDVLINITGDSILRTCVADQSVLPARVNQHVSIVRPQSDIPPHFIHQHLLRPETKNNLLNMSSGATRKAITKGHLEAACFITPMPELLAAFQNITDPLFERVSLNREQSRTLAALRDTLLPKLISGEVRVKDIEMTM